MVPLRSEGDLRGRETPATRCQAWGNAGRWLRPWSGTPGAPRANRARGDHNPLGQNVRATGLSQSADEPRAAVGLIARDRELAGLDQMLRQCRVGEPTVVVLRGEPGIGKSSLIEAVVARARDFHVVQLRAGATGDAAQATADWPAPLVELFDLSSPEKPPAEPSQLAAAVDGLAVYPMAPLLLTIDDAQLLPQWFLEALVTAVRSLEGHPFAVILGIRDSPHMPEVTLPASSVVERRLSGLKADQALVLLDRMTGVRPSADVAKALARSVGGNPQALLDASAHLLPDVLRGWRSLPDPLPIGDGLAAAFGEVLSSVPVETRRCLSIVAAGRAPMDVLKVAFAELGLDLSCLDAAAERGIVIVQRNRIEFAHPLVRAAAYHLEEAELRSRGHEALSGAFLAMDLVEPGAWHASRSASVPVAEVIALYGRAVRAAAESGHVASAARYEELMADVGDTAESVGHHLARAASWWLSAGELVRAVECIDQGIALPVPDHFRGELCYWRCRVALADGPDPQIADDLVTAAELSLPRQPGRAAEMLAEAAICLVLAGRTARAEKIAARAVKISEIVGGLPEAVAGAVLGGVRVLGHRPGDGKLALKAAMTFLTNHPDGIPLSPLFAYVTGLALLEEIGPEAATTWANRIEQMSWSGDRSLSCVSRLLGAVAGERLGHLEEAADQAVLAARSAGVCGQRYIGIRAAAVLVDLHSAQGRYQETFAMAAQLLSASLAGEFEIRAGAYRALAEIELQQGRARRPSGGCGRPNSRPTGPEGPGGVAGLERQERRRAVTAAKATAGTADAGWRRSPKCSRTITSSPPSQSLSKGSNRRRTAAQSRRHGDPACGR